LIPCYSSGRRVFHFYRGKNPLTAENLFARQSSTKASLIAQSIRDSDGKLHELSSDISRGQLRIITQTMLAMPNASIVPAIPIRATGLPTTAEIDQIMQGRQSIRSHQSNDSVNSGSLKNAVNKS
jgi:hypothetical protein